MIGTFRRQLAFARVAGASIAFVAFGAIVALPVSAEHGGSAGSDMEALEEIYVLRSIREEHVGDGSRCASSITGFEPYPDDAEREFSFWSIASRSEDGRIVDTSSRKVADLHGCFGPTDDRTRQNFHAEIHLRSGTVGGRGECQAMMVNVPEQGMFPVRCQVVLTDVPAPYVGGLLTTNTLTSSAKYGGETSPPGYAQASIATIRLWRKRKRGEPVATE